MSNPTPYEPGYEYSGVEPIPGNQLDNDFANLKRTTDELIGALADVRRSDGALNNGVVTADSLSDGIANQIIAEVDDQVLVLAEQVAQDAAASEQSATDAAASASTAAAQATLASQWAAKTDGPVAGGEYSSKYWAERASEFAGLPLVETVPPTNVGPVYVPGQGPMEHDPSYVDYVVLNGAHGQCRFNYFSSTECRLTPHNGNGLIVGYRQVRIPSAGVSLSLAGLVANTMYRVYAYMNAGVLTLEASTTAHARGVTGIEQKLGDATRTLVGLVYIPATIQFLDANSGRCVLSWFNRAPRPVAETATTSVGAGDTGLGAGVLLLCWGGDMVEASCQLSANIANANSSIFGRITKNGTAWAPQSAATAYGPGASVAFAPSVKELQTADTPMTLKGLAATNGGNSTVNSYLYASAFG